jgi:uncharacterized protein YjbI with pentapeptide repeats
MPNEEHLNILNEGYETWNAWRHDNPGELVELEGANLCAAVLSGAALSGTNLRRPRGSRRVSRSRR